MAAFPRQRFENAGFLVDPEFGIVLVPAGDVMELSRWITELIVGRSCCTCRMSDSNEDG
jgi:hypothetical protein